MVLDDVYLNLLGFSLPILAVTVGVVILCVISIKRLIKLGKLSKHGYEALAEVLSVKREYIDESKRSFHRSRQASIVTLRYTIDGATYMPEREERHISDKNLRQLMRNGNTVVFCDTENPYEFEFKETVNKRGGLIVRCILAILAEALMIGLILLI